jgi:hypothetical protein
MAVTEQNCSFENAITFNCAARLFRHNRLVLEHVHSDGDPSSQIASPATIFPLLGPFIL